MLLSILLFAIAFADFSFALLLLLLSICCLVLYLLWRKPSGLFSTSVSMPGGCTSLHEISSSLPATMECLESFFFSWPSLAQACPLGSLVTWVLTSTGTQAVDIPPPCMIFYSSF